MRATLRAGAAALLIVALPAQAAQSAAAKPCISEGEVRAMMAFAMPSVLTGLIDHCTPHLASGGFMRSQGGSLVASYAAGKQSAWPRAKTAFLKFAGDKDPASVKMVAGMPDSALQPFVEAMVAGLIGSKLKPGQCALADRMLRLLAPLPAENTIELLGTIVSLAGADTGKRKPTDFAICKS